MQVGLWLFRDRRADCARTLRTALPLPIIGFGPGQVTGNLGAESLFNLGKFLEYVMCSEYT